MVDHFCVYPIISFWLRTQSKPATPKGHSGVKATLMILKVSLGVELVALPMSKCRACIYMYLYTKNRNIMILLGYREYDFYLNSTGGLQ